MNNEWDVWLINSNGTSLHDGSPTSLFLKFKNLKTNELVKLFDQFEIYIQKHERFSSLYAKCRVHNNHHLFCRMVVPRNLVGKRNLEMDPAWAGINIKKT